MRRSGGLLEHETLGIKTRDLTEEERSLAIREHRISLILDQLSQDQDLRRRVRAHLAGLPADKPGPKQVLSSKVVFALVEAMVVGHGYKKTECYKLLSRDGLSWVSIEAKYKREKKAREKRGTEN